MILREAFAFFIFVLYAIYWVGSHPEYSDRAVEAGNRLAAEQAEYYMNGPY